MDARDFVRNVGRAIGAYPHKTLGAKELGPSLIGVRDDYRGESFDLYFALDSWELVDEKHRRVWGNVSPGPLAELGVGVLRGVVAPVPKSFEDLINLAKMNLKARAGVNIAVHDTPQPIQTTRAS